MNQNTKNENTTIEIDEFKLKYLLSKKNEMDKAKRYSVSYFSFFVTLMIALATCAKFNAILGFSEDIVKAIFVVFAIITGILSSFNFIKFIIFKINKIGSEEWLINEIKGIQKEKREFHFEFDFAAVIRIIIYLIVILIPIGLWVFVVHMIGWDVCFSRQVEEGKVAAWAITLFISIIYCLAVGSLYFEYGGAFIDFIQDHIDF